MLNNLGTANHMRRVAGRHDVVDKPVRVDEPVSLSLTGKGVPAFLSDDTPDWRRTIQNAACGLCSDLLIGLTRSAPISSKLPVLLQMIGMRKIGQNSYGSHGRAPFPGD